MPQYKPGEMPLEARLDLAQRAQAVLANAPDEWARWHARWLLSTLAAVSVDGMLDPRREQLPPPEPWTIWFLRGGRGSGKTRPAAEDMAEFARRTPNALLGFAAPKIAKFRDVQMEGVSGLLNVLPPSAMRGGSIATSWNRSLGEFYFSNGTKVKGFSSEKPDEPRGYNLHRAWADEPAEFGDADLGITRNSTFSNLMFALRAGKHPQMVVSGTPTNCELINDLIEHPRCHWVQFATHRNLANLSSTYVEEMLSLYEGTSLGLQEIYAELVAEVEGALWTGSMIDMDRIRWQHQPDYRMRVVGLDPSMGREAGIVVCGVEGGPVPKGYILEDRSVVGRGSVWATAAVEAYHDFDCHAIVCETNLPPKAETIATIRAVPGGDTVRIVDVTAHEGKAARAGPIVAMQQQHRVKWVGSHGLLEQQCKTWVPPTGIEPSDWSPNRLDAMVWAMHYLLVKTARRGGRIGTARGARVPTTLSPIPARGRRISIH